MKIENKILEILDCTLMGNETIEVTNCIIDSFEMNFTTYQYPVEIYNCIIGNFLVHSTWFTKGLKLINCIIKENIHYEMGGHNVMTIIMEGNIFMDFFNFFDCQFDNKVIVRNNVFVKGSNLLSKEGYKSTFNLGIEVNANYGTLDINEF